MSRTLLTVLLVSASLAVATAQTGPKPGAQQPAAAAAPTADDILEKYVQALGGRAAFEKINSRVTKGSYEIVGTPVKGEQEVYSKAPNMATTTTTLPGLGVIKDGYDGQAGWAQDPAEGLRELKGAEHAAAKFDAEFNKEIRYKQLLRQLEVRGSEKVGGREAHVVVGTAEGVGPVKMYFDKQTGLLSRFDTVREGSRGKEAFEVYFEDYREVDGVRIPFGQRWQTSDFTAVVKLTSVKHNEAIEDAKFKKPSP